MTVKEGTAERRNGMNPAKIAVEEFTPSMICPRGNEGPDSLQLKSGLGFVTNFGYQGAWRCKQVLLGKAKQFDMTKE